MNAETPKMTIVDPDREIIDPHHHLFDIEARRYRADEIWNDVSAGHRIRKTVFVTCRLAFKANGPVHLQPVGETERVVQIAQDFATRKSKDVKLCAGIVGYVDLREGDKAAEALEQHIAAADGRFRGIRQNVCYSEDNPELNAPSFAPYPRMMAEQSFRDGMTRLGKYDLSFDALIFHPQILELVALAQAVPGTKIVVNHVGVPLGVGTYAGRRDEVFVSWKRSMAELAKCENVFIKLGGLAMPLPGFGFEKERDKVTAERLAAAWKPYFATCIEQFGASRCMFESNFPVDAASTSYAMLWNAFKLIAKDCSEPEKDSLFRGTASKVYRI